LIRSVEERVTSINRFLRREVSFEELKDALIYGFQDALKIKLVPGDLLTYEEQLTARLETEKYTTREWNFKR
jgi:lipoate-protein ligase A